jgi:hypothetical protein
MESKDRERANHTNVRLQPCPIPEPAGPDLSVKAGMLGAQIARTVNAGWPHGIQRVIDRRILAAGGSQRIIDFYIGKRLHNLPMLRRVGFQANRRLLEVEKITHDCILAEETFQQLSRPRQIESQRASALRFGDPKVQALWSALLVFPGLPTGFSNQSLRESFASLLGRTVHGLTPNQMTYQLRRLRLHGIIERIPQSHRYRLTDFGLRTALFCTRTYARILRPGFAQALPEIPCANTSLRRCFNKLQQEIHLCVDAARLAA